MAFTQFLPNTAAGRTILAAADAAAQRDALELGTADDVTFNSVSGDGSGLTNLPAGSVSPLVLGTNLVSQYNGLNAQASRIYNTYTDASNGEWFDIDWQTTSNVLRLATNNNGTGTVRNIALMGGNVGIGTTATNTKLDIRSESTVIGSALKNVTVFDTTAMTAGVGSGFALGGQYTSGGDYADFGIIDAIKENGTNANTAGALRFHTRVNGGSFTERMRITSAGNVGIGTTSPAAKLDIRSESTVIGSAHKNVTAYDTTAMTAGVGSGFALGGQYTSGGDYADFGIIDAIKENGTNANTAGALRFHTRVNGGAFTERMRIASAGEIGIGVTSPTAKLHLPASTTAAGTAPIKLATGTLMTTPEAGAIEYDGTNLYFTDSGGTRRTLAVV